MGEQGTRPHRDLAYPGRRGARPKDGPEHDKGDNSPTFIPANYGFEVILNNIPNQSPSLRGVQGLAGESPTLSDKQHSLVCIMHLPSAPKKKHPQDQATISVADSFIQSKSLLRYH